MANEQRGGSERTEQPREADAAERIEKRRELEKEIEQREDEGWGQPESSAQKLPEGPQP